MNKNRQCHTVTGNGTGTQVLADWLTRTGTHGWDTSNGTGTHWYTGIGTLADSYWRVLVHRAGTPAMVLVHRYWHTGRLALAGTGTLGWDTSNGTGTQVLAHWPTRTGGYWYNGTGTKVLADWLTRTPAIVQWYWSQVVAHWLTRTGGYRRVLVHWYTGNGTMVLVHW